MCILEHYEDVIVTIFQYIEMIKETGIKKWIFDEIKSLAEIEFRFSEKCPPSQYTSFLSQQMQENLPPQWTISGSHILRKYDAELIQEHLDLLRPDNFRLTLAAQEFPHGIKCTKVEKWYSTDYEDMPLRPELMAVSLYMYIKSIYLFVLICIVWGVFFRDFPIYL